MASKATSTAGVRLKRGDGATPTEVFTAIAEVFSISGPEEKAAQIDVTSFESAAREYIGGLRDGGEIGIEYNLVGEDTTQSGLRADFASGVRRNFLIDLDDVTSPFVTASKYAFAAVVTAVGNKFSLDDKIVGSATLKISGAVAFTPRA